MADIFLTEPQTEFHRSTATYVAAVAGFGSGKTQVAVSRMMSTKLQYPSIDLAYLAPTYGLIRDIFYPYMSDTLTEMGLRHNINKSENNIYIQGMGKIYCRTMSDPTTIVGWECGDAFMDEFDVLRTDKATHAIQKVSARCRQRFPDGKKNQKYVTTTPEGFKATYNLFKKEPLEDSQLIQMSTYSNARNLPPNYISDLKKMYPDQLVEAYLNGVFINLLAGTVYYTFDRDFMDTDVVAAPREPLHIGLDFNVYNMAAVVHVVRKGIAYAVDELVGLRDTPDVIEALKERYPGHRITVYPDASGKGTSSKSATLSDIKLLKDARFTVKAKSSNPLIKDRVTSVNSKIENQGYFVNTKRCPQLTEALEQQIYDASGRPDKNAGIDHVLDAIGYFIHYLWPILKSTLTKQIVRGVTNVR